MIESVVFKIGHNQYRMGVPETLADWESIDKKVFVEVLISPMIKDLLLYRYSEMSYWEYGAIPDIIAKADRFTLTEKQLKVLMRLIWRLRRPISDNTFELISLDEMRPEGDEILEEIFDNAEVLETQRKIDVKIDKMVLTVIKSLIPDQEHLFIDALIEKIDGYKIPLPEDVIKRALKIVSEYEIKARSANIDTDEGRMTIFEYILQSWDVSEEQFYSWKESGWIKKPKFRFYFVLNDGTRSEMFSSKKKAEEYADEHNLTEDDKVTIMESEIT